MSNFITDDTVRPVERKADGDLPGYVGPHRITSRDINEINDKLLDVRGAVRNIISGSTIPGLAADGVTDDSDVLQAFIDASPPGTIVTLPEGVVGVGKPILINKSKILIQGQNKDLSRIRNLWGGGGCVLAIGPTEAPVPTTTEMGHGPALDLREAGTLFETPGDWWLNFRECNWMELHGRQNLCFELQFKTDTTIPDTGAPSVLAYSQGRRFTSAALDSAFLIETCAPGDGQGFDGIAFSMTLGTTKFRATTNAFLQPSTYYHLACTYDGFTMRIWVNGTQRGSLSASGLITMKRHEMIAVGNGYTVWPDSSGVEAEPLPCLVDSFRVTAGDRYSTAFTPPAPGKLTRDSETLFVCNYDETYGPFTISYGNDGKKNYHMALRPVQGVEITSASVKAVGFEASYAGAIHAFRNVAGIYEDLDVSVGRYAINLRDNCYLSRIRGLRYVASQPNAFFGVANLYASGPNVIEDVDISCPTYGMVFASSSVDVRSVFINGCNNIGVLSRATTGFDKHTFQTVSVTDENQDLPFEAAFGFDGPAPSILTSCALDAPQNDAPLVFVDSRSGGVFFNECLFQVKINGTAPLFKILGGTAANEVRVRTSMFNPQGAHPRSDTPGHVVYDTDVVSRVVTGSASVANGQTSASVTFGIPELDTSYRIQLTPGANVAAYFTSKSTTGFTVNLASASVGTTAVDWVITR